MSGKHVSGKVLQTQTAPVPVGLRPFFVCSSHFHVFLQSEFYADCKREAASEIQTDSLPAVYDTPSTFPVCPSQAHREVTVSVHEVLLRNKRWFARHCDPDNLGKGV